MRKTLARIRPLLCILVIFPGAAHAEDDSDEFDFLNSDNNAERGEEIIDSKSFLEMDEDEEWDLEPSEGDYDEMEGDNEGEYMDGDPVEDEPDDDFDDMPGEPGESGSRGVASSNGIGLATEGLTPLTDSYPVSVVAKDLDAVVIELPVLVSRNRSEFSGEPFWIVASIKVDGIGAGETKTQVTGTTLADLGPSFIWVKSFVPVSSTHGVIEVAVSKEEGGVQTPLFTTSTSYSL